MNMQTEQIPHFMIVGVMKSGTTTLLHHLRNHRKIHAPPKELYFFNKNFHKGVDWYRNQILKDRPPEAEIFGEKTLYSYGRHCAERIYNTFPNAKLIWVFRNPIDRAYSNYLHGFMTGREYRSFPEAVRNEAGWARKDIFYAYTDRSIYDKQVERFLDYFPMEQMHFVLFEDLIKPFGPEHILHDVFNFLGADSAGFEFEEKPRNKTILPRYPSTIYMARKAGLYQLPLINQALKALNYLKRAPGYEKMPEDMRRELRDYFKPHNQKLENLIGRDLSVWDK